MIVSKKYRSRFDLQLFWPYLIFGALVLCVSVLSRHWYVIALLGMPIGVILGMYFNTHYTIWADGRLEVVSQSLPNRKKVIAIASITSVKRIKNSVPSPALSKERLEVCFNEADKIFLSPAAPEGFVEDLLKHNPLILVDAT